jgi:putative SOS response-associated peptidase YedK
MCGRFTQQASWAEVVEFMQPIALLPGETEIDPAYNIAPSQACWTLRPEAAGLQALRMRWGLLPAWAKDAKLGYSTFNARAESMAEKPAFRSAFRQRRCLVPASGYYEWQTEGKAKQPFYIHAEGAPLLLFAALWEPAHPQLGELPSVSIVTREAEGAIRSLHHRVPLMLDPEQGVAWCRNSAEQAQASAVSGESPPLAWHAVDRRVGNVREQGPELCAPINRLL